MKKRYYYSVDLANMYEQAAHDIAVSGMPYDMGNEDLKEYERMEWLAHIWEEITYVLHGKWY